MADDEAKRPSGRTPRKRPSMDDFDRRLASAQAREAARQAPPDKSRSTLGVAFRLSGEFIAGVGVGTAIGWGLDRLFGTKPFLLILFIILGFAAGMLNVFRTAKKMDDEAKAAADETASRSE